MDSLVNSFLSSLYKSADDSFVGITTFPGPVTKWFDAKSVESIASYALKKMKSQIHTSAYLQENLHLGKVKDVAQMMLIT